MAGCLSLYRVSAWILGRRLRRTKLIEVDESRCRVVAVRSLDSEKRRRGRGAGRFWGESQAGRKKHEKARQLWASCLVTSTVYDYLLDCLRVLKKRQDMQSVSGDAGPGTNSSGTTQEQPSSGHLDLDLNPVIVLISWKTKLQAWVPVFRVPLPSRRLPCSPVAALHVASSLLVPGQRDPSDATMQQ
jgi:hypothetical protein